MRREKEAVMRWSVFRLLIAALCLTGPAQAQDAVADFYRGKTVTMVVGLPPGGSFDLYARLIATHLGRHIPGQPSVILQNMPGAGSVLSANHVYAVAPQDGTVIAAPSSNVPLLPLLDNKGVAYDSMKVQWLPTPADSPYALFVWSTSAIHSMEDLKHRETPIGALAPGSTPTVAISLYNEVFKTRMRPVIGYRGLPSVMMAIERGEVEGYATVPVDSLRHTYRHQMEAGQMRILLQSGDQRDPHLPDVPTGHELITNPDDLALYDLGTASTKMTFPYFLGPGVPPERVAALRKAFMDTFADPKFVAEAAERDIAIKPIDAQQVTRLVAAAFGTRPDIVARLHALYDQPN
jgi:tripartite-type tricarboxylate transporter receptor subunit TctC